MFDKFGIYKRYESCHNADSSGELARILGIARQTTNAWKNGKSKVPWWRLKELVVIQGISWDWLLTERGSKHCTIQPGGEAGKFDTVGINTRYLSLFPPGLSQAALARLHNVSQVTIHKWQHGNEQVSWEKLNMAVSNSNISWNWLIEGVPAP